jgi:hypothetical protein
VEEGVKEALEKMIELFNVTVQLKSRVQVKERGGDNVGGTFKARDVWYQQSSSCLGLSPTREYPQQPVARILCIYINFIHQTLWIIIHRHTYPPYIMILR